MKYFLGISNFLEEISSLSHSVVFLYFFALIYRLGMGEANKWGGGSVQMLPN